MVQRTRSMKGTTRPFRLWNEQEKKVLPHRCYEIRENAKWAALRHIMPRATIDTTITVYNAETARVIAQYTRKLGGVLFLGEKNVTAEAAEQALVTSAQGQMGKKNARTMGKSRVQGKIVQVSEESRKQAQGGKLRIVKAA